MDSGPEMQNPVQRPGYDPEYRASQKRGSEREATACLQNSLSGPIFFALDQQDPALCPQDDDAVLRLKLDCSESC